MLGCQSQLTVVHLRLRGLLWTLPYSGLFPWGANFRYFRGSPGCHEIFHPRNFHTLCSAVNTCSNLDQWCFVKALRYLPCPWSTGSPFSSCPTCEGWGSEQRSVEGRSTTKRKWAQYLSFNTVEPKVTSTANGSARLPFSRWHSSCSSALASQMSL